MLRRILTAGSVALAVGLTASTGTADGDAGLVYPRGGTTIYETSDPFNRLAVECTPISPTSTGQPRIECTFLQTVISLPKTQQVVDAETAEEEKAIRDDVKKDPGKFWASCAKPMPPLPADLPDETKVAMNAAQSACAKKDVDAFVRVLTTLNGRATKTCKLETFSNKEVLTRLDANTWTANVGPRGVCNLSLILTLWRDSNSTYLWNYKQVRTMPENEHGPMCQGRDRLSIAEYRWNGRKGYKKLGCEFIN